MNIDNDWTRHCENEPLAHSGAIQPHGLLIYLDSEHTVVHVSAQIENFLPLAPNGLLDQPLPDELAQAFAPCLAKLPNEPGGRSEQTAVNLFNQATFDIVANRNSDGIVIELTPQNGPYKLESRYLEHIKPLQTYDEVMTLHQEMAELFHRLTGFNRVMIYVFREDGDGEVLAEARHAEVYGSYLGLRFPGSDIPKIARDLYMKNPWRLIPDSQASPVPLLSRQKAAPDLTWSDLRSVSPVHLAYLANMGVRASLSFPIKTTDDLWGLIACHHAEPRGLSLLELQTASRIARNYNLALLSWQALSRIRFSDNMKRLDTTIRLILLRHGSPMSAVSEIASDLMNQFDACGMAVRLGDDWQQYGEGLFFPELEQLDEWFENRCADIVYSCDSLSRSHAGIGYFPVSGAIALKLGTRYKEALHLWLFRRELLHDVEWGGNPHKPAEFHNGVFDVAPRRSFEKFVEKRMGFCSTWKNEDRLKAIRLRQLLQEVYG